MHYIQPQRYSAALQRLRIIDEATNVTRSISTAQELVQVLQQTGSVYGFVPFTVDDEDLEDDISGEIYDIRNYLKYIDLSVSSDDAKWQRDLIMSAVRDRKL